MLTSPQATPSTGLASASEALALAEADPERARVLAAHALHAAETDDDPRVISTAEHALGLAARRAGELSASLEHLERAIRAAERHGLEELAAEARVSLLPTLMHCGDLEGAEREAEKAAPAARGAARARLELHRATVLMLQGRLDEALEGYRRALPALRRCGDVAGEANLLNDRGLLQCRRGNLVAAQADLRRAEELYAALGCEDWVTNIRQNRAVVASRAGDIPAALALFDQADAYFAERGKVDSVGLYDRCESLLAARLLAETRQTAERAIQALEREGRWVYVAEVRLMLAEAALLEGDAPAARAAAAQARRAFSRQGRPTWVALARYFSCRAAWLEGERSLALLVDTRRAAAALDAAGFTIPALDARLLAARLALELGRSEVARRELTVVSKGRRRGPAAARARAWYAEALLRLAAGNRRAAEVALRTGVGILNRYRATLGATELRASSSVYCEDLARLGLHLALADASADRVLAWAERWRAGSLWVRPARPPNDARLAADLASLRALGAELEQAALSGRPTGRILAQQAALERVVRDRARHAPGDPTNGLDPQVSRQDLAGALGDQVLVEMVDDDGLLYAVVMRDGRTRLQRLASLAEVEGELEHLRFVFRRLVLGVGSAASADALRQAAVYGASRLDELLLGPLAAEIGQRSLVLVPTGPLHALPWSVLPSCRGRPVTVAPSAAIWHRAATQADQGGDGPVVLIAGPGLEHADAEVEALSQRYPDAHALGSDRATCHAACAALGGSGLAHVAAHGRFRTDNPLFSALQLTDGALTVYDLESLQRSPRIVILSACDAGMSAVRPGNELMGLAAAVLALGTQTLIASVTPVRDAAIRPLMLDLHGRLREGVPPATALARAQAATLAADLGGSLAGAGLVCYGAGHRPL